MRENPSVEAADTSRGRSVKARMSTWVVRLALTGLLIGVTLVVGGGVQAVLNVPDLESWHRLVPRGELRAAANSGGHQLERPIPVAARPSWGADAGGVIAIGQL